MANHTITILNRNVGGSSQERGQSRIGTSNKKTSAYNKKTGKVIGVKPGAKSKAYLKAAAKVAVALAAAKVGVNIYTSVMSAATGEEMKYSNTKALANSIINPLGFIKQAIEARVISDLQIERANEQLNYQRQLTGNLVYSRKFINGTF